MDGFWKDLTYAARLLRKHPGFTAVAVLILAFGIGANTAIFSLLDALLLQDIPVRDPGRLVLFSDEASEGTYTGKAPTTAWPWYPYDFYEFLRAQSTPLESVCAFRMGETTVTLRFASESADVRPKHPTVHLVSGNYFSVLGVDAERGRVLQPTDDLRAAAPVAVMSYPYWKQRLNADPSIVGKVAILNDTPFTIVGVAPPDFFGERIRRPPDFWLPLAFQPTIEPYKYLDDPDAYWLNMIGRLRPGAQRGQAQAAVTIALQQFLRHKAGGQLTPQAEKVIAKSYIQLYDGGRGISGLRFQYSQPLHILLAVVAMVLLIASANVGSLLLARANSRRTEISVRLALGASRSRLIRQLLTESFLLAGFGASFGLLLARWGIQFATRYVGGGSPQPPHLNGIVLLFTLGVTLAAAVVFGLAPALQSVRVDLVIALKAGRSRDSGGRTKFGGTRGLVTAQLAVSLVLLVGAGLFARSLLNLQNLVLGFDSSNVLLARINPKLAGYTSENVGAFYRGLLDRINALPGVTAATLAYYSPLSGSKSTGNTHISGYTAQPGESLETERIFVCSDYSKVLGIPLILGRELGPQDTAASPKVAMVNESFVRHYFPNRNPLGNTFGFENERGYEIVGVLRDAHFQDPREKQADVIFLSYFQERSPDVLRAELEVRTSGDSRETATAIRGLVSQTDPRLPLNDFRTLHQQVDANFDRERLAARFVTFFSGLALLLACIGLYGVVAQDIVRRKTEIGVRIALGAQPLQVLWMVLAETALMFTAGLAIGVPMAIACSKLVSSQLFGLRNAEVKSYVGAILVLAIVTTFAALVPARRAARVDPMVALRYE